MKIFEIIFVAASTLWLASSAQAQTQYAQPLDWSPYASELGVRPGDAFGQKLATLLQKQAKYNYNWVDKLSRPGDASGKLMYNPAFDVEKKYYIQYAIRPLAHFAWGSAAVIRTGIYSVDVCGISQTEALARTEMAIRGAAMTHLTNASSGQTWGNQPQSAYWAAQAGEASWMLWSDLSDSTRQAVAKMVQYEADRFLNIPASYWADKTGYILHPGDTQAENDAWNARVLQVAQEMMPGHPNAPRWREKASEFMIASYSRQCDLTNNQIVCGKAVKDWLGGYNAYDNGGVVNHNIIHPDYTTCNSLNQAAAIGASLAKRYIPECSVFNADVQYDYLTKFQFTPGASPWGRGNIVAPGGTIYTKSTVGDTTIYDVPVYYPQNTDWSRVRYDIFAQMDMYAVMRSFVAGDEMDADALSWVKARVDAMLAMQDRPGHDGNLFQDGDWITEFIPKEQLSFNNVAEIWMLWWLMQNDEVSPVGDAWNAVVPEPEAVTCLPDRRSDVPRVFRRRKNNNKWLFWRICG